jgi:hypothetical protein
MKKKIFDNDTKFEGIRRYDIYFESAAIDKVIFVNRYEKIPKKTALKRLD